METILQDLRYGFRMMLKKPGFTLVAIFTLALGIGANTAIFSVINAVLLKPLPYKDSDQLVLVWGNSSRRDRDTSTPADFLDWRAQNSVFEHMAGFSYVKFNFSEGDPERISGASVSTNFFELLKTDAAIGRAFTSQDGQAGNNRIVVLSYGFWLRRFGGDRNIIGRSLTLNDQVYTVLGIMPSEFKWSHITPSKALAGENVELWVPAFIKDIPQLGSVTDKDLSENRGTSFMRVLGRLKEGVTIEQAQTEMTGIAARLAGQYPDTNTGRGVILVPIYRQLVGDVRTTLFALFAAVGFVLLISCANVANLFLARAATRQKEIAIRAALGAGRLRLVRQMLTESILLALISAVVGLILALWGLHTLIGLSPEGIPRLNEATIDTGVLGFTLLVSILTGLFFGLLPAIQSSRPNLQEFLKEATRGSTGARHRFRSILVVSEIALTLVLLIGAGLLLKSLLILQEVRPGFDSSNLLTFKLSLSPTRYTETGQQTAFFSQMLERIRSIPGVQDAGAALTLPFAGDDITFSLFIEGRPAPQPGKRDSVGYQVASPGYFQTMRIPFLKGRDFTVDDKSDAPGVAVINREAARRYWPDEDPVGKRIRLGGEQKPWLTIIGVVEDVKHYGLDRDSRPEAYVSYMQYPFSFLDIVVRSKENPLALVSQIKGEILSMDKDQPISSVRTMDELMSDSLSRSRFTSLLVGIFGALALILAAIGIYGVISFSVAQRTQEIGIRMALGAQRRDILSLIVGQGMIPAFIGVVVGLITAFALTRLMSSLLYGVSTTGPVTFVIISGILIIVALLASYIPARRATKVDPMVALRYE